MIDINNKNDIKKYFEQDEVGNEMFECVQSIPPRFREDALDIFCDNKDRNMWNLKTVNKAWTYFLEEIVEEMTEEEKKEYGF